MGGAAVVQAVGKALSDLEILDQHTIEHGRERLCSEINVVFERAQHHEFVIGRKKQKTGEDGGRPFRRSIERSERLQLIGQRHIPRAR